VAGPQAQQSPPAAVSVDADDIGGVVTGRYGPEIGVWVIAETTDLGTRFAKMVVTDDRGRYLIPDLPAANYQLWVRGYGLVDSAKVAATRGRIVNLTAAPAPSAKAAAEYYPAIYWFSMLSIPDRGLFPGTGPNGNGMPVDYQTQEQWLNAVQLNGCGNCHQLGDKATREIPEALGKFDSSVAAWQRRLLSGPAATSMATFISRMNTGDGGHIKRLAEWTDRIKAGEIPASAPSRPHGVERNLVVTVYDWLSPKYYIHDLALTDRRKPTVNGYGLIYGSAELSTDDSPILDPVRITKSTMRIPIRDQDAPSSALANKVVQPSPYFGTEQVWDTRVNAHNPMLDHEGRVYYTAQHRSPKNPPAYCAAESGHPSAKVYPLTRTPDGFVQNSRQVTVYDPKTKQFTFIDTCFGTHHLNFGEDANHTLWLSNNLQNELALIGWVNTKLFWETRDAGRSQGWSPLIVDTSGNGRRDAWVEHNQPEEAGKDKRLGLGLYGIAYNPVDGSIWGSNISHPGWVIRVQPGSNPSETALAEIYKVPAPGFGMRGFDIDRNGVAWVTLASGHMASFDRRRCKGRLNGPGATRATSVRKAGRSIPCLGRLSPAVTAPPKGPYYSWVDQHDILGLGPNTPIGTGNFPIRSTRCNTARSFSSAFRTHGLLREGCGRPHRRSQSRMERPWPLGDVRQPHTHAYRRHGRPDSRRAGKTLSSPLVVHFQLRPDPLAK
jgi:hypothetical protein